MYFDLQRFKIDFSLLPCVESDRYCHYSSGCLSKCENHCIRQ
ncbi:24874_t:CDS:2 [Dentiscutata erythropus]|uniref:24874_t:CDS:1 n=1 Tax=Dentiscutata erythropus TaxID=1348616 RepID=A0A9N9DQ39_9GLOM|nr:24874_t:CDS:2 [Dentiscutata erythropus]